MNKLDKYLNIFIKKQDEIQKFMRVSALLNFDMETLCPSDAMNDHAKLIAHIDGCYMSIIKDKSFIKVYEYLYKHLKEIPNSGASYYYRKAIEEYHLTYCKVKDLSLDELGRQNLALSEAFDNWQKAKQNASFDIFKTSLDIIKDITLYNDKKWVKDKPNFNNIYDSILFDSERGITTEDLDKYFNYCKEKLIPLLKKIKESKKVIRTDFLSRPVSDEQQRRIGELMLDTIGFNFNKGVLTTSEHPFTESITPEDSRVTTHYYQNAFNYSMYSCLHEGGHALFMQNANPEPLACNYDNKSNAQHESVSRFYENILGSSKEFISYIYPKLKVIIPDVLKDVTSEELYEALNVVEPTLIRTEADELTYTLHIIIRYEIEKDFLEGKVKVNGLPALWNHKYKEYLGITPENDAEGILQDVHWSSGFGYFPSYALGNMCNAMYYQKMLKKFNVKKDLTEGRFDRINEWMQTIVYSSADTQDVKDWIKSITGEDLSPVAYIKYLEDKYTELYQL